MRMVIVGGGQAAVSAAGALRDASPDATIEIIGAEPHLPYQRPPLSKAYLKGEMTRDRLELKPAAWYEANRIALTLGAAVTAIDRNAQSVRLADGSVREFDRLLLATGGSARRLPAWGAVAAPFVLRDLADIDALSPVLRKDDALLVIGGGYIGLEMAAAATELGLIVTLVEAGARILQRVAAPQTSDYFRALHTKNGVTIHEGVTLDHVSDDGQPVAHLSDGTTVPFDVAVAGVGLVPNDELAADAGLHLDRGIAVDGACATSDPNIFAAGDCVSFPYRGARIRLESVQNAIDQGKAAGRAMAGEAVGYAPEPWFWSDQFDVKLQIAGVANGADETVVRQDGARHSVWYFAGEDLCAVDTMNDPRGFMIAKRLLAARRSPPRAAVADPSFDLRSAL
ncbi:MAG: FAD-dependent oxidoreductase [Pseudomonadota bacterium]